MTARLAPALALADVYGPRCAYAPRAHPATCGWLSRDAALLDSRTGNQRSVAGGMPVVCSAGLLAPAALELTDAAGLSTGADACVPFHDEAGAVRAVRDLAARGTRVALQHAYPPGVLPDACWRVPPAVLAHLNNKANLCELVPAGHAPTRRSTTWAALRDAPPALPVVLKVATDLSTGAGAAVAVCRTPAHLAAAHDRLGAGERVIVEDLVPIARNACLNYAVLPDGSVRYLGFADQETTDGGGFVGSWLMPNDPLPAAAVDVGLEVARRGAALGYRGVCGFDVIIEPSGRPVVIDLNFRVNGSTTAVLLASAIADARGPVVIRARGFACDRGFDALIGAVRPFARRGHVIPVSLFDPARAGRGGQPARAPMLIVTGPTKQAVLAVERELTAALA